MHNSLKFFRATGKTALFADIEQFMQTENVTGKSISIEHDGGSVVALLGYLHGNPDGARFYLQVKSVCKASESDDAIQAAIDRVADEVGSFICQGTFIENGDLSVVFLMC